MKNFISFIFFSILFFSCQSDKNNFIPNDSQPVNISHFDRVFFNLDSNNLEIELNNLRGEFPYFFSSDQGNEIFVERFFDSQLRELYVSVDSLFGKSNILENEIQIAFQYFYYYFPEVDSLTIYTWVSNFESLDPIIILDQTLLIALDMYLGSSIKYYKSAPEYIRYGFNKDYILPDIFYYYFSSYIPLSEDNSFLASIIYYGKIHYLTSLILPKSEDSNLMKYSKQKMTWAKNNESNIWTYFIDNNILFSSSKKNKIDFIFNAPFSKFRTSWQNQSPGRIGQWIGWKIIDSYMQVHPELNLIDLIMEEDSQKILKESRYKPKKYI